MEKTGIQLTNPRLWYERDIDLIIRRDIFNEINPQPYLRPEGVIVHSGVLDKVVSIEFLREVRKIARIDEQEARLGGQNRYATLEQRSIVWLQERGKCAYCDVPVNPITPGGTMQVDHIDPIFNGGKTFVENLVCSCAYCNKAKGVMDSLQYLDMLSTADNPIRLRNELYIQNTR